MKSANVVQILLPNIVRMLHYVGLSLLCIASNIVAGQNGKVAANESNQTLEEQSMLGTPLPRLKRVEWPSVVPANGQSLLIPALYFAYLTFTLANWVWVTPNIFKWSMKCSIFEESSGWTLELMPNEQERLLPISVEVG